jgi:hypothetical protein
VACIYIGWEVGGYMIDLIWYLFATILSYLLGTLTNSKPNLLHDRSNLVLMCYNLILSVRNSNKLETKCVMLGVFFSAEGPQDKDHRKSDTEGFLLFMLKLLETKILYESSNDERQNCYQAKDEKTI